MSARARTLRRRQDWNVTKPAERVVADRSAAELYEQLWLGSLRSGTDINAPEKPLIIPGYHEPSFDAKRAKVVAAESRMRLDDTHKHRMEVLSALRKSADHMTLHPFQQILIETEFWTGSTQRLESAATDHSSHKKGALHRSGGGRHHNRSFPDDEDNDLSQQTDAATGDAAYHVTETPSYIRGKLRDYQLEGVNWLLGLHCKCINGVLADEMGLGKTFQTIATLATLKFTYGLPGPHLVVCPKSVLGNWFREFRQWCPSLRVFKFHAPGDSRPLMVKSHLRPVDNIKYDVVVTTFEMVLAEVHAFQKIPWQYLIIDEAHKLKNEESQAHVALASLHSSWRLIMTGTPLQNNLRELWALLHFLVPELFAGKADVFNSWFDSREGTENSEAIKNLHIILAPLLLRRLKQDVNTGIPPKKEIYVSCQLSRRQREWYSTVLAKDAELLNKASGGSTTRLSNIIMQLRKVVNHPYLMPGGEDGPPFKTDEWIVKHSGKMIVLDKLLRKLFNDKAGQHKVLVFSQFTMMLDIIEDYCNMAGFKFCRIDGSTTGLDREMQMAQFNLPTSDYFIFLLSTRAGGVGINLQAANHVILYDSDWNPQMDLQAQDRAHRIGQKRSVRVYRLIVDGTMEEKLYKRCLKKLYLDAMVVQQGRVQSKAKNQASAEELLALVRFGAEEVFKSRGADVSDADIDQLLQDGEERLDSLAGEMKQSCQQSLASFKLGADEANLYDFEGVSYATGNAASETKNLHVRFPDHQRGAISQDQLIEACCKFGEVNKCVLHPNLQEALMQFRTVLGAVDAKKAFERECGWVCHFATKENISVVTREMIDECFNTGAQKFGRGQRQRGEVRFYTDEDVAKLQQKRDKAPPLKLPKPPTFPAWQLYNIQRLLDIHNTEVALLVRNWRRRHDSDDAGGTSPANGGASPTSVEPTTDGGPSTLPVSAVLADDLTLSEQEQEEKQRLLAEGFPQWTRDEFRLLKSAITSGKVAPTDYRAIADRIGKTKTEGEVRDYMHALLERGPRCIPHFEKIEAAVEKAKKKVAAAAAISEAVRWKMEQLPVCGSPHRAEFDTPQFTSLKFAFKSKDVDMDRRLFYTAFDLGLHLPSSTPQPQLFGSVVRRQPDVVFDVYYQTRSDPSLTSRMAWIFTQVKKEWEKPDDKHGGDGDTLLESLRAASSVRRKKKAKVEDGDVTTVVETKTED